VNPTLILLAGPNGAGKSTYFEAYLSSLGLPFLNADLLSAALGIDAYSAAKTVATVRDEWIQQQKSFITETVLSDPVGEKVNVLRMAAQKGYDVTLVYVYIDSVATSEKRVAIRTKAGGHDVPKDKIRNRYDRTLKNLARAIHSLPRVIVVDNNSYETPHRFVAEFRQGECVREEPGGLPEWLTSLL